MNKKLGMIAAVVAFCCALVVGSLSPAQAKECTTQGALALAMADVLGIKVTSAQAAADELAKRGIAPKLGWNVEACLTDDELQEVKTVFGAADFERALVLIGQHGKGAGRNSPNSPPPPNPPNPPNPSNPSNPPNIPNIPNPPVVSPATP